MLTTRPVDAARSNRQPAAAATASAREQDAELVEQLLADDPRAWRLFNERYSRLIYRCITKITSRFSAVVSPDDVREIYAMLCLQLLANDKNKLRSYEPSRGVSLGSWLGLLSAHAAYDFLRTRRREPRRDELSEVEPLPASAPNPYELCEVREKARIVMELLATFSDRDQQFIELFYGAGLDPEAIARRMNISVKTVYSKKHKIQARLETLFEKRQLAA